MLTYDECRALPMRGGRRKLAGDTYLYAEDGAYVVRYYGSALVVIHADGTRTLSACGRLTATTKKRINEQLPYSALVYQRKGDWHYSPPRTLDPNRADVPFFDGLRIDASGRVINARLGELSAVSRIDVGRLEGLMRGQGFDPADALDVGVFCDRLCDEPHLLRA